MTRNTEPNESVRPRLVAVSHTGLVSGAERVLLRALEAAVADGWSVSCLAPAGPLDEELGAAGVPRIAIPELKLPAGPRPVAMARLFGRWLHAAPPRIRRAAAGADLVLANGLLGLPALAAARVDAPVVWLVHDVLRRRDARVILRTCRRAVTVAVALSEAVAEPLRRLGLRVVVIPNGTPWPVEPAHPTAGPRVVGINAVLTEWKGHEVLFEAFAKLEDKNAVLECMGATFPKDVAYAERLAVRASRPDLSGRVRFLGHVADPVEQMRSWSVAVSASIDPEAAPLSVLEAMSLGVPVVGTDHGGTPEAVGEAGLLVPPRDAVALWGAIDRLLADGDLASGLVEAGLLRVEARYSLAKQEERLLSLFRDLARCGVGAGPATHPAETGTSS